MGDLGFDFRAKQIRPMVVNGSPPLRCVFGAVLPKRWAVETGLSYSLHASA